MSLILSPNQLERGQNSLVENDDGDNQFERIIIEKEQEIEDIKEGLEVITKKDDFHAAMLDYSLRVSEKYWDFMVDIYDMSYNTYPYEDGALNFPTSPKETVDLQLLSSTEILTSKLNPLDPLSFAFTYLTAFSSLPFNSDFDRNWHPFNYNDGTGVKENNSSLPYKGAYFLHDFNYETHYNILAPIPPTTTHSWDSPLEKFGTIIGSVEILNNYIFPPTPPGQLTTLTGELTAAFNALNLIDITTKIQETIDELTEPEYSQLKTDLQSLKTFISGVSQVDLLTEHLNWQAQLDVLIPPVIDGYKSFMDKNYIFFNTRMSRSGGYLPAIKSDLDRIPEIENEIQMLKDMQEYIEIHIDPLP